MEEEEEEKEVEERGNLIKVMITLLEAVKKTEANPGGYTVVFLPPGDISH